MLDMSLATIVRWTYLPVMLGTTVAAVAGAERERWLVVVVSALFAIGWNRCAEAVAPYEAGWNTARGDRRRDIVHAITNESLTIAGLLVVPLVADLLPWGSWWPSGLPFAVEVLIAVVVADVGITLAHVASHRRSSLWRLHAVHHSVTRMYGLNGLMKHPLHQGVETLAGVSPLLLMSVPTPVAVSLAAAVVIQLNVQHSNATYVAGILHRWFAFNQGHRLHHRNRVPDGDVNFGLFLLAWDRVLGTYVAPDTDSVHDGAVGLAGSGEYPVGWLDQVRHPFLPAR